MTYLLGMKSVLLQKLVFAVVVLPSIEGALQEFFLADHQGWQRIGLLSSLRVGVNFSPRSKPWPSTCALEVKTLVRYNISTVLHGHRKVSCLV